MWSVVELLEKVDGEVGNVAAVTGSMMLECKLLLPRRVQPGLDFWVPEVPTK